MLVLMVPPIFFDIAMNYRHVLTLDSLFLNLPG